MADQQMASYPTPDLGLPKAASKEQREYNLRIGGRHETPAQAINQIGNERLAYSSKEPASLGFQPQVKRGIQNNILRDLDGVDFTSMASLLEPVTLKRRQVLQETNRPIDSVYFIEEGLVSIKTLTKGNIVEAAIVGRNGIIGSTVALRGTSSMSQSTVLVAGRAWKIASGDLRSLFVERPKIRERVLQFVESLLMQISQTALCGVRHSLEERLACWLYLACESLNRDILPLTHDQLSLNLGLRRTGLTEALIRFEQQGIIRKARGFIQVREHQRLKKIACDCCSVVGDHFLIP